MVKVKWFALGVLALAVFSFLACAAAEAVEVPPDGFDNSANISRAVTVTAGGSFELVLPSNPTTGFRWAELAEIVEPAILEQTKHEYIAPDSGLLGAGGKEVWTFRTLKQGTTTVYLEYSRPWEGGGKPARTFTLSVTVK